MSLYLKDLIQSTFIPWLETQTSPAHAFEGVSPDFASLLNSTPELISFDQFKHQTAQLDWEWKKITFSEMFDGYFMFYAPVACSTEVLSKQVAKITTPYTELYTIYLAQIHHWQPVITQKIEEGNIIGLYYFPTLTPSYLQWIVITEDSSNINLSACFTAGEWVIICERVLLQHELDLLPMVCTSMVTSEPWGGWLEQARKL